MAIFNSYVKLPEGIYGGFPNHLSWQRVFWLPSHHRCGGQCDRRGSHRGGHGGHFTFEKEERNGNEWGDQWDTFGYIYIYIFIS